MEQKKKITVDLFSLFRLALGDKRRLALYVGAGAALGLAVAFGTPRIYKSAVKLAPEMSGGNALTSNITKLSSMIGMNMSFGNDNDAIYPEIYPDMMKSNDFVVSLFPIRVRTADGSIDTDYYDYMATRQKAGWWMKPVDLVQKVKQWLSGEGGGPAKAVDPFRLTKKQDEVAKAMLSSIDCSVDKKTNVITIEVTAQDAQIAATLCDSVKARLQVFITRYRTNKAQRDLEYAQRLAKETYQKYVDAQHRYAAYCDANQEVELAAYKVRQDDLENEMQLAYNAYQQVCEQLQLSRAKVQERTPAFTVLQSASVPVRHSNKPKLLVLCVFMFLGAMARLCVVFKSHASEVVYR